MPKKKIAPEIQYPYFFDKELFEIAKNKLYRKNTTELNSAITRQKWFLSSPFCKDIYEKTFFCSKNSSFSERFYCYKNGFSSLPLSSLSGKPLKWNKQKNRYNIGASIKESLQLINNKEKIQKFKNTISNKHKNIKDKLYNNFIKNNYNLYSLSEIKSFIENLIKIKDYGRHGKWVGIEDYTNNKDFLCSILFYTKEFESYIKLNDWSQKLYIIYYNYFEILQSYLKKYNKFPHYVSFLNGYTNINPDKFLNIRKKHKEQWLKIINAQGFEVLDDNYLESDEKWGLLKCNKCSKIFKRRLDNGRYYEIYCYHCEKEGGVSKLEKELRKEIQNFYKGEIIFNKRDILNGKELDIFIPEKNIAIELNGVLWHSFGTSWPNNVDLEKEEKEKHYKKYKKCESLGIQLLQFTDLDYYNKKDIILNIIKSKLGIYNKEIYARKCDIKLVSKIEKRNFCEQYHIQGDGHSQIEYGLYYNNELVSVMTFGKRKITKGNAEMEIIRYCTKNGIKIIGGASKLLSHFLKDTKCKKLKTYSDNSISDGNVYKKLGFKFIKETKWNYWYLDCKNKSKLLHRSNFMRHKLNTNLTEKEEMYNRGYRRYYDAGNKIFLLET